MPCVVSCGVEEDEAVSDKWTLSSLHQKRYGDWSGRPQGTPPDPDRCCVEVWPNERGPIPYQCQRKRGFGPEQAYCKQHDPDVVAARRAAADAKYKQEMKARSLQWGGPRFFRALKKIAEGHNDPRTLAQETIKDYE
jgi:hypothetical protein